MAVKHKYSDLSDWLATWRRLLRSMDLTEQINAVDFMLLNAFGTTYKLALKISNFVRNEFTLSEVEEMLSAKNILSNLGSVLDYCCIILHCSYNNEELTMSEARKQNIKFPVKFSNEDKESWEKKELKRLIGEKFDEQVYEKFKGVFSNLMYQDKPANDCTWMFYTLRFLRNSLTHCRSDFIIKGDAEEIMPRLLETHQMEAQIYINVHVPDEPWNEKSKDERHNYVCRPLLDVLHESCQLVRDVRDAILTSLGHQKFETKYNFKFECNSTVLRIESEGRLPHSENSIAKLHRDCLHFECYGIVGDIIECDKNEML